MKNISKYLVFAIMTVVLFSCADATNIDACRTFEPYGFFGGFWHGLIAPFSFFFSLLDDSVEMYASNNIGGWYDLGFVLGAGILFGGGTKASSRKRYRD